jgi:plastocyanin
MGLDLLGPARLTRLAARHRLRVARCQASPGQIFTFALVVVGGLQAFLFNRQLPLIRQEDVGPGAAKGINRNGWIVGDKIDPAVSGHTGFVPTLWKPTATPPPPPAPGLVRVGTNFFASTRNGTWNPAVDTVAVGRTLTWDWFGGTHSVQSLGSPSFTSSAIMSGAQSKYTFTFSKAGTYQYNCVRHPKAMSGRIIVK